MNQHREFLLQYLCDMDDEGRLRHRESKRVEFKKAFQPGMRARYAKTMAAFANASGGYIIFGVTDRPRVAKGLDANSLRRSEEFEPSQFTIYLNEHFSPEIEWEFNRIDLEDGRVFAYIFVNEAENKPVICRRQDSDVLREGAIYYRYRGQTREIRFEELHVMLEEIRQTEQNRWMRLFKEIARIGPESIALMDMRVGELKFLSTGEGTRSILIDRDLVEELRKEMVFIEEGRFSEKEGAPTLKLVGQIQPIAANPEETHPYDHKSIAEDLSQIFGINIRRYDVQALVWKLGLSKNKIYYIKVKNIPMLSGNAKDKIKEHLDGTRKDGVDLEQYLRELRSEYHRWTREKGSPRRKHHES